MTFKRRAVIAIMAAYVVALMASHVWRLRSAQTAGVRLDPDKESVEVLSHGNGSSLTVAYRRHCSPAGAERPTTDDGNRPPAGPPDDRPVEEIGGPPGPEPTRYGDWLINGRGSDF